MPNYFIVTLVLGLLFASISNSAPDNSTPPPVTTPSLSDAKSYAGQPTMNDIRFEDYKDFAKKWHFVTVRFRRDTNEMRLTYANDAAWDALNRHQSDFPEGAVFGKIGIATEDDPQFHSSAVPAGARRYQFMVRNKKKYATTNGWGYALFDASGATFPEDPKATSIACAACHKIVPERGDVFSQAMQGAFHLSGLTDPNASIEPPSTQKAISFSDIHLEKLPESIRTKLPPHTKHVRMLEGTLRENLFQGTLDEIRPVLADEALRSGFPALLLSKDGTRYSMVFAHGNPACNSPKSVGLKGIHNIYFEADKKFEILFCHSRP